ncbi:MAG: PQQ-binding-like beta-propeller repeat protein [Thermoguttaceae bacterium]
MKSTSLLAFGLILFGCLVCSPSPCSAEDARDVVGRSGITGGLVVHVGCGDARWTADLRIDSRYLVQGLEQDAERVARARAILRQQGTSGEVTVLHWDGKRLPYAENMVNLMVVDSPRQIATDEILRVLAPRGIALIATGGGRKKLEKPWPKEIDQWTHFLHGPDNNAVAEDTRVEPPKYLQWVSGPRWGRSHDHLAGVSAVVSASGRIFSIIDEGSVASVKAPSKWMLVARDAFNGVLLWKRPLARWENQLRPFRSGPAELPRRLVAVGDRVYVTLGYDMPVTCLDAATGKVVRTYEGTKNTHEIVCHEGTLYLVISEPLDTASPTTGKILRHFPAWRDGYAEYTTQYMPRHVRAIDAASGGLLWKKTDSQAETILPLTLIVHSDRVFFQNEDRLIALEADSGNVVWTADRPAIRHRYAWLVPTLVVNDGVVLSADRLADRPVDTGGQDKTALEFRVSSNHILTDGQIMAFSAEDGKPLWTAPCHEGFNAPVDVFVIGGRVYSGISAWGKQPGITKVYDLHTGRVVATRKPDQESYTFGFGHHRCHRNKATTNYVIQSRAGIEFLDVDDPDRVTADHWVRGVCQYGILPCNGLVYAPTHPCACFVSSKLSGYNALSGRRAFPMSKESERLERGPAFAPTDDSVPGTDEDAWPTFRHDNARSGATTASLSSGLQPAWEQTLPGPLTAPVVAHGRLFVAGRETHTVHALKSDDGTPLWSYTAGGRVDSPPTIHQGRVYFGSADGWMTCLQAEGGALVWRFRVAPESRQIVSYDRLESVWPVHGSVLVCDGPNGKPTAYAAAGRTSYVDGGVHLCGVDAATGRLVFRRRISHRDPKTGLEPQDVIRGVNMPGAMPDVLATDGESIFMRHQRFDFEGRSLDPEVDHLFCSAGFLDDTWWHRTYLQIGRAMGGGYGGWTSAGNREISGRALVRNENRAFGFGRKGYTITGSHIGMQSEYHLFAADIEQKTAVKGKATPRGRKPTRAINYVWSRAIPFYPRAMLLAGDTLLIAGPDNVADFDAKRPKGDVSLWAVSTEDGSAKARYKLKASPVHDSFAACAGRLFFTTVDGRVVCYEPAEKVASAVASD